MNANGKKTGLRVAAFLAVAGATVAMAGPSSSEGVALDQVVMVNKDAPQQQGRSGSNGGGGGDRSFLGDIVGGDFLGGGSVIGGDFIGGSVAGDLTGDGSIAGNTNGNSLGNTNGNQLGD